jgi:hypothetical protein
LSQFARLRIAGIAGLVAKAEKLSQFDLQVSGKAIAYAGFLEHSLSDRSRWKIEALSELFLQDSECGRKKFFGAIGSC